MFKIEVRETASGGFVYVGCPVEDTSPRIDEFKVVFVQKTVIDHINMILKQVSYEDRVVQEEAKSDYFVVDASVDQLDTVSCLFEGRFVLAVLVECLWYSLSELNQDFSDLIHVNRNLVPEVALHRPTDVLFVCLVYVMLEVQLDVLDEEDILGLDQRVVDVGPDKVAFLQNEASDQKQTVFDVAQVVVYTEVEHSQVKDMATCVIHQLTDLVFVVQSAKVQSPNVRHLQYRWIAQNTHPLLKLAHIFYAGFGIDAFGYSKVLVEIGEVAPVFRVDFQQILQNPTK